MRHVSGGTGQEAKRRPWSPRLLCLALLAVASAAALAPAVNAASWDVDALLAPLRACPGSNRADMPVAAQLRAMSCLVAYARARAGVPAMRVSHDLDRAATSKIEADLRCGEFTHTPCGDSFVSVYFTVGYARATRFAVGENLAWAERVEDVSSRHHVDVAALARAPAQPA